MENRDRDKLSKSEKPTEAGDVNRETSRRESNSDLEFGEKIGRSENPENEPSRNGNQGNVMTGASSRSEH